MPNWCSGYLIVRGKPKNIENFCKLFIFSNEDTDETFKKKKYFARSFIHYTWKNFKKEFLDNKHEEIDFYVDFAWSGWSCLIDGYPQQYKKEGCVTLEWACKKYDVEVTIETEEWGMGFEELIKADKNGVNYDTKDMPTCICKNCGEKRQIPSSLNYETEECYECGKIGFTLFDEVIGEIKKDMGKITIIE